MDIVSILITAVRAAVGVPAAAYALAGLGLNLQFGYTGLLNFGHAGFLMSGAYGMAVTVEHGGPLWLGFIVGVLAAAVFGLLLGIPTLRLRADYLAIVTIAAAEILRHVVRSSVAAPVTRGVFGITRFANDFYAANPLPARRYGVGSLVFSHRNMWVILVGWLVVAAVAALLYFLLRSPWGRVLRSIREDEDAVRSLGKNTFVYKLQSLVFGGVIGAGAGMLLAIDRQSITPDSFQAVVTFFIYTVIIIGGPGRVFGPIIGAVLFWFLQQFADGFLRAAVAEGWFGTLLDANDVAAIRVGLVGVGLMLLMVFRPQGIFGNREEMLLDER